MGMSKTDNKSPDMPVADEPDMKGGVSERPSNVIYLQFPKSQGPEPIPRNTEVLDDMILHIRRGLSARCKECASKLDESERSVERSMVAILVQKGLLNPEDITDEDGGLSIKTKDGSLSITEFFIKMKF